MKLNTKALGINAKQTYIQNTKSKTMRQKLAKIDNEKRLFAKHTD